MARSVLITGGTGFIGSSLKASSKLNLVKIGSEIDLLCEKSEDTLRRIIKENKIDAICHLAWNSNSNANYLHSPTNTDWADTTRRLIAICEDERIDFLFASSASSTSQNQDTIYGKEKQSIVDLLLTRKNINFTILNLFYIVSINPPRPRLVEEIVKTSSFETMIVQSGDSFHDYIKIEDVAGAIELVLDAGIAGMVDIGAGFLTSNKDIVEAACRILNLRVPKIEVAEPFLDKCADTKVLKSLGWSPNYTKEFLDVP